MNPNMDDVKIFPDNDSEPFNSNDMSSDGAESNDFLMKFDASLNSQTYSDPVDKMGSISMGVSNSSFSFQSRNSSAELEHWRTFEGGREATQVQRKNNYSHYRSLGEQRANANRQFSSRGQRQYCRRGRGRGVSKKRNSQQQYRALNSYPPNTDYDQKSASSGQFSDSESVPSTNSWSTMSSKPVEVQNVLQEKFQSLNINAYSGPYSSEVVEGESSFSQMPNINQIPAFNSGSVTETETNTSGILSNDKIDAYRKTKEAFENVLKTLKPADIVMNCRQLVETLTKDVVFQNLKKIDKFKSSLTPETKTGVSKRHLENLFQQHKEFENFITKVKGNLSSIIGSDIQELVISSDVIRDEVENESRMFKKSLPAYGHKSKILSTLKKNQVTIISADAPYFLNSLLPIFVKSEFKDHYLISCETSEVLKEGLKSNVFSLVQNRIGVNNIGKDNFDSKFKFMTVEELSKTFLEDYTFSEKNTFLIMNLPLKRSLVLDIMLADVRDMLQNQKKAKLILLVPKVERTDLYEMYFSDTSVSVMILPALTLPVTTVWKSSSLLPTDDYINEVLKTILSVHILDKDGDIMAFLPSYSDAKTAAMNLRKKIDMLQCQELKYELLHEGSMNKNCLSLFDKRSSTNQTVYFVTDCGESVILPSVSHIIDCGLKEELIFDSTKKLDVMTTTLISCKKAQLRKSLAGICRSGICYRLYCKSDFNKEMPREELPELLTVNPYNSLIKIFHHRKVSAVEDEFVENLQESVKKSALNLLKKSGALKDNKLTEIGKRIVKLPFPARYSKFILMGIEWGIGYDVILLVAFFQEKDSLFLSFEKDIEKQKIADAMKVQLSKNESDALTFLHIYKIWHDNDRSKLWSDTYCINLETLKNIENRAKEICLILGDSLKENIKMSFSDSLDYESYLDILFECFKDNLCVYSGHYRSGYRVLSSHCFAFLHSTSIVSSFQEPPQFIIFDHMISSSRDYLVNITIIPPNFVMNALSEHAIDFDYSDMYENLLVQKPIEPVSERIIKQMLSGKKLKVIEDYVKEELSTHSIVIEPIAEKGKVSVFALEPLIEKAVEMVKCIIDTQLDGITKSEETKILDLKRGQFKLPVEIRWLKGAHVASVKVCDTGTMSSQNSFNVQESDEEPICQIQKCVSIKWVRRKCSGYGFVTYNAKDFFLACRRLAMKTFRFNDTEVFIQRSKKSENQLYLQDLPPDTDAKDLEIFLKQLLPGVIIGKLELEFYPPFKTSEKELQYIKNQIGENCRKFAKLVDYNIVVPIPEPTDTFMTAFVVVTDDVNLAAENLSGTKINKVKLICRPVYRSIIKCSINVSISLESRFRDMLTDLTKDLEANFGPSDHFTFEVIKIDEDLAAIKMLSKEQEILEQLLRNVNELLEGELVDKNFNRKLNKIFCHGGHMWLKQTLEKSCNVYVMEDNLSKTLRLYGSRENCALSKDRIMQFLDDTENEGVRYISFSGEGANKKLLKAIIVQYGVNLEKLIESTGLRAAVLDIKKSLLSLHGSRKNIEDAEECLKGLTADGMDSEELASMIENDENCPVCSCAAYNLSFRLELCGHLYCSECIQALIDQADFPLQCCECSTPLSLDDIHKVLGEEKEKVDELVEKSLKKYIDMNKVAFYCCPAPDCSMFFDRKEITEKIHCPLCQNDICTKCNVVFHQGFTCDMYQGSKLDPDYSFKVWKSNAKDCKHCPRCSHAIERYAGCDHMHCQKCQAHFCWVCLTSFPTDQDVYNHLPFCPKHPKW